MLESPISPFGPVFQESKYEDDTASYFFSFKLKVDWHFVI